MSDDAAEELLREWQEQQRAAEEAAIAARREGPMHIRRQASKEKRGNQWYKAGPYDQDPQRETLCGAPAGFDLSWAETRWAKNLAFVTCDRCKELRTTL